MSELKPCPFCGKTVANVATVAEHEYTDKDSVGYGFASTHFDVVCDYENGGCGASTGKQYDTPEEAIDAWNRRVGCESADEYTVSNRPQDGSWRVGEGEKG